MNLQEQNREEPKQATLESWKEIAAYLQRDAKTARRWEKEEGLPIHRHSHKTRSSVYAYPGEIDAWRASRRVAAEVPEAAPAKHVWRMPAFALTGLLCLIMVGNGIRPEAASAEQKHTIAKRLVCADCGEGPFDLSRDGRLMVSTASAQGYIAIRDMSTGRVKRLLAASEDSKGRAQGALFSPDLRQIVYLWMPDGYYEQRFQLRLMPNEPGGKSRVVIDNLTDFYTLSGWFPDGKSVLLMGGKQAQLVRVTLADGTVKALKSLDQRDYDAESQPHISPDGRYIAYSALAFNPSKVPPAPTDRKDQHIYILAADGSSEAEIVKASGVNRDPAWTPDGKHILFVSDRSGKFDLWSIAVQNGKAAGAESLVSPEIDEPLGIYGGSFYYAQQQQGDYIHVADGGAARSTESFVGIRPAWSPDGKSIAFKRHHPGSEDAYDLVVRSLETGEERTYLTSLGTSGSGAPVWFHDGSGVMTGIGAAPQRSLHRIDLKSGDFKELPAPAGPNALSPDDKTLYLVRRAPDGKTPDRILSIDVTTGQERPVFVSPATWPLSIALSPDGRTLVLAWIDRTAGNAKQHIARVSVDGGDYREVFTGPDHLGYGGTLAWSKDGRSILFNQELPEGAIRWGVGVMRVPADGGGAATLVIATPPTLGFDPGPDGSRIAYSAREAENQLWALDNVLTSLK